MDHLIQITDILSFFLLYRFSYIVVLFQLIVYIALDEDAKKDAYNLSEFFRDFGIDSKVVKLPKDKDPNDLGFEKMNNLIDKTISSSFSDMIQAKLYG